MTNHQPADGPKAADELLPCPFCGATPTVFGGIVVCETVTCILEGRTYPPRRWNKRQQPPAADDARDAARWKYGVAVDFPSRGPQWVARNDRGQIFMADSANAAIDAAMLSTGRKE